MVLKTCSGNISPQCIGFWWLAVMDTRDSWERSGRLTHQLPVEDRHAPPVPQTQDKGGSLKDLPAAGGVLEEQGLDGALSATEKGGLMTLPQPSLSPTVPAVLGVPNAPSPCWQFSPEVLPCALNRAHLAQQYAFHCLTGQGRLCCQAGRGRLS